MRSSTKSGLVLAALSLSSAVLLGSAGAQEKPTPADPARGERGRANRILDELSEPERERFRAALNEVWHAEEVERRRQTMLEANLAYRKAIQDEIRKMDASSKVRAILLKIFKSRFDEESRTGEGRPGFAGDRPGHPGPEGAPRLSVEERAILKNARLEAEASAEVQAAKDEVTRAVTTRQRSAASGQYRRVMRRAMEQADPRVKQILGRRDHHPRPRPKDPTKPPE